MQAVAQSTEPHQPGQNNSDLSVVFTTITISQFNMIKSAIQNKDQIVLSVHKPKNIVSTCIKKKISIQQDLGRNTLWEGTLVRSLSLWWIK